MADEFDRGDLKALIKLVEFVRDEGMKAASSSPLPLRVQREIREALQKHAVEMRNALTQIRRELEG